MGPVNFLGAILLYRFFVTVFFCFDKTGTGQMALLVTAIAGRVARAVLGERGDSTTAPCPSSSINGGWPGLIHAYSCVHSCLFRSNVWARTARRVCFGARVLESEPRLVRHGAARRPRRPPPLRRYDTAPGVVVFKKINNIKQPSKTTPKPRGARGAARRMVPRRIPGACREREGPARRARRRPAQRSCSCGSVFLFFVYSLKSQT